VEHSASFFAVPNVSCPRYFIGFGRLLQLKRAIDWHHATMARRPEEETLQT
jgi:hypothetical protein